MKNIPVILMLFTNYLTLGAISPVKKPKVILIGIDGVRTDAFQKAVTPNLDRLKSKGFYTEHMNILSTKEESDGADTLSGPGWASILTGVWPKKHFQILFSGIWIFLKKLVLQISVWKFW